MHFHCSLISLKICLAAFGLSSRPAKQCGHWSDQKEKSQATSAMKLTTNPVKSVAKRLAEEYKWFGMDEKPDNFGNPNSGSIFKFVKSLAKFSSSQDLLKPAPRSALYNKILVWQTWWIHAKWFSSRSSLPVTKICRPLYCTSGRHKKQVGLPWVVGDCLSVCLSVSQSQKELSKDLTNFSHQTCTVPDLFRASHDLTPMVQFFVCRQ